MQLPQRYRVALLLAAAVLITLAFYLMWRRPETGVENGAPSAELLWARGAACAISRTAGVESLPQETSGIFWQKQEAEAGNFSNPPNSEKSNRDGRGGKPLARLPKFDLQEGESSFVIYQARPVIYLALRRPNGAPFTRNSVTYALCHELAHLLHPGGDHGAIFLEFEASLQEAARRLGLYDPEQLLEPDYPCQA